MKTVLKKSLLVGVILILSLSAVLLCACNNDDNFRNPLNGEPESGAFYTLQTAYDNGWISKDDLRNIAYYHMGDAQKKGFKPLPKNPETLDIETDLAIREDFVNGTNSSIALNNLEIVEYYGTYDSFVAIKLNLGAFMMLYEETIGDIHFKYNDTNTIVLWKE